MKPVQRTPGVVNATISRVAGAGPGQPVQRAAVAEAPPTVDSLGVTSGHAGDVVPIRGNGLAVVYRVQITGLDCAASIVDDTLIEVVVPVGAADGPFVVTSPQGSATSPVFDVLEPGVTSLNVSSGGTGSTVVITGHDLTHDSVVDFGGVGATSITVDSLTQITAIVPAAAVTGAVRVTTGSGSGSGPTFSIVATVTGVSPSSGRYGDVITFTGTGFADASAAGFNGTAALSFSIISPTTIHATLGDATTGAVSVTTGGGTATGPSFTVSQVPTIFSLSSPSGSPGDQLTLNGIHLDTLTGVTQNGVTFAVGAHSYFSAVVTVPESPAFAGVLTATNPAGTGISGTFSLLNFWFQFDLADESALPPGLAQSTSAAMPTRIVATGISTTKEVSATTWTYDKRGTSYQWKGLWVAWPVGENVATRNMGATSNTWKPKSTNTVTDGYAVGPDGTMSAARFNKPLGTTGETQIKNGTYANATSDSIFCFYVKDDTIDPPTIPNRCVVVPYLGGGNARDAAFPYEPTITPDGTTWHRVCASDVTHLSGDIASATFVGAGAKTFSNPIFGGGFHYYDHGDAISDYSTTSTGSILGYAGLVTNIRGDLPAMFGADPNAVTPIPSLETHVGDAATLGTIVKGGKLDLQLDITDSVIKALGGWTNSGERQYVFSSSTPNGANWLRLDQQGAAASINGVTTGLDGSGAANVGVLGEPWGGAFMRFWFWNDPVANTAGWSVAFNGCRNATVDKVITSPGGNATPTDFYLGSNGGASSHLNKLMVRAQSVVGRDRWPEEFVIFGDSTAALQSAGEPFGNFIYRNTEAITRPGIVSYAGVSGHSTQAQAKADWDGSPYKGKDSTVKAVIFIGWFNDILSGGAGTANTLATAQNTWHTSIRATNPSAKIIWILPIPFRGASGMTSTTNAEYDAWIANLKGTGSVPVTNIDALVDFQDMVDLNGDKLIDNPAFSAAEPRPLSDTRAVIMGPQTRIQGLVPLGLLPSVSP